MHSELIRFEQKNDRLIKKKKELIRNVASLSKKLLKQSTNNKKAKEEIQTLTDKLTALNNQAIAAKKICDLSKVYDSHTRKCIYSCLESQVPVEKAGVLVNFILRELSNTTLTKIPAPSTVAQMAYEMGIIADLQAAEQLFLATDQVATIAWDATTIDGCHYNEINITLNNNNTHTLEVGKLAGGTTEHYIHHLENTMNNIANLYSLFTNTERQVVFNKFKEIISSTLSDRAPVNSCVSRRLSEIFSKPLVKLHCNLHPLDGLASEAKKVLKKFDEADGIQSNFWYRGYKMISGDPAGFQTFLRLSNIKSGVIARYVGNRLHILFHLAGVIIQLKDSLCVYLENYCKDNTFRLALLQDLKQPAIIRQLRVLGLFGKLMTGPWMTLFYKNESKKKHLDMVPFIKHSLESLRTLVFNPRGLLENQVDCFGNNLDSEDQVLTALRNCEPDDAFFEIAKSLADGFRQVLERQLHDYVAGDLSNASPDLTLKASSAPLHNMHSERALGMFDAHCYRSKNASAGFIDGKIKFKLNNTNDWLQKKDKFDQERFCLPLNMVPRKGNPSVHMKLRYTKL